MLKEWGYKIMGNKKIVSKEIVESDAFLSLTDKSKLGYFYLMLASDDYGFIGNPKRALTGIFSNEENGLFGTLQEDIINELKSKKFILEFDNGVCVIKHYFMQNVYRKDRLSATNYFKEQNFLELEENNSYKSKVRLINAKIPTTSKKFSTRNTRETHADYTQNTRETHAKTTHNIIKSNLIKEKEKNNNNIIIKKEKQMGEITDQDVKDLQALLQEVSE